MLYVRDLMTTNVEVIDVDDNLTFAQAVMSLGRFHHLPVVKGGRLVGILSCRDLCRSKASDVRSALSLEQLKEAYGQIMVAEIMSRSPQTISPDAPAADAAALLRRGAFSAVPVVENGRLVGIVTTSDFLDAFIRAGFMEQPNAPVVLRADRDAHIPWAS